MPQEVINGSAILHGIRNDGTAIGIGYTAFIDTAKLTDNVEVEDVKDEQGYDAATVFTNQHEEVEVTLTPKSTTRALVEAATVVLEAGDSLTFEHFAVDAYNGTWIYRGGQSIDLNKGKEGKVTFKVRKYKDATQNTSLATTVSG
jgi:hypothetical protein